jgi:hypothetical protein
MDHYNSDEEASDDNSDLLPILLLLLLHRPSYYNRVPTNRRWTSQEVVDDLLNCGNPICIHNQLRMQLDTFVQLRDWLILNIELKSSRFVSIEEKLLIFIYIASTGASNQATQERFNRSPAVISWYIFYSNSYSNSYILTIY